MLWDPGDEVSYRAGEGTTRHACMGPSTKRAPEDGGFGGARGMVDAFPAGLAQVRLLQVALCAENVDK